MRSVACGVLRGQLCAADASHNVGRVVPAAVGYRCRQVGYLKRSGEYLALSDCHRDDRVGAPAVLAVHFVVELAVGDESAALARKVDAEFVAEAHFHKVVLPNLERLAGVPYFERLSIIVLKPQQKYALHDVRMAGFSEMGDSWPWQPTFRRPLM